MQEWNWKVLFHYLVMLASLFILIFYPPDWELRLLLGVIIGVSALVCIILTKQNIMKRNALQLQKKQENDEEDFVKIMNVARHNWLNEMQVLYAYIQLKKYDNLHGELEKINQKLQKESYISRLGHSSLIAYIYYFRLVYWKMFQLEVDLEEEMNLSKLPFRGERIALLIQQMMQSFFVNAGTDVEEPNKLKCTISLGEDGMMVRMAYHGLINEAKLREMISELMLYYALDVRVEQQFYEENTVHIDVRFPFRSSLVV